jgi:hypothetical protein
MQTWRSDTLSKALWNYINFVYRAQPVKELSAKDQLTEIQLSETVKRCINAIISWLQDREKSMPLERMYEHLESGPEGFDRCTVPGLWEEALRPVWNDLIMELLSPVFDLDWSTNLAINHSQNLHFYTVLRTNKSEGAWTGARKNQHLFPLRQPGSSEASIGTRDKIIAFQPLKGFYCPGPSLIKGDVEFLAISE